MIRDCIRILAVLNFALSFSQLQNPVYIFAGTSEACSFLKYLLVSIYALKSTLNKILPSSWINGSNCIKSWGVL